MNRANSLHERLAQRLDERWPWLPGARRFGRLYPERAAELAALVPAPTVLDLGAGRETPFAARLPGDATLVGVDLHEADLQLNEALDVRIAADIVADGLPPQAYGADLVTSRMVLEHVRDTPRFVAAVASGLRPGGWTLHLFAGRYSAFALANRLPSPVARRLLFRLRPESAEVGGYPAFYHRTDAVAAARMFREAGFTNVSVTINYQVSQYFRFFFPLYLTARCWESGLAAAGARRLGAYVLLCAQRPER